MSSLIQWLNNEFGLSADLQHKLVVSAIAIVIILLIRGIILHLVFRKLQDDKNQYVWKKSSTYVSFFVLFVIVGRVWFVGFSSLSTFLGLVSAGLAIALQTPIINLAGWAFILWRRPFEVGDRIEISGTKGDVIDQRIFMFSLMEIGNWVDAEQSTGRIIHVPNGNIFRDYTANYSKGFYYIWNEIPVLITFESNWKKAEKHLIAIVSRHSEHLTDRAQKRVQKAAKKYLIFYQKLTPIVYLSVKDSGVLLTLRYLCDPRQRRGTTDAIWRDILMDFAKCKDIDFAYPTQRFYNNRTEGKSDAGGPQVTDLNPGPSVLLQ